MYRIALETEKKKKKKIENAAQLKCNKLQRLESET